MKSAITIFIVEIQLHYTCCRQWFITRNTGLNQCNVQYIDQCTAMNAPALPVICTIIHILIYNYIVMYQRTGASSFHTLGIDPQTACESTETRHPCEKIFMLNQG